MRKLIALLCLITALVVALGPPGWATTVLPLNDTPANALPVSIVATPTVNDQPTTTDLVYKKPSLSITELLYYFYFYDEYTVYCWADEANANGYYPQEGEYPLTDSTTTSMI